MKRYRETERELWNHYGLEPNERFLDLDSPAVRLRVLEVGSGDPVVFVHGTVGPGSWPSLIRELPGVRSIVLERPGRGIGFSYRRSSHDHTADRTRSADRGGSCEQAGSRHPRSLAHR